MLAKRTAVTPLTPEEQVIGDLVGLGYPSRSAYTSAIKRTYDRLQIPCIAAQNDVHGDCTTCGEAGRCPGWHIGPLRNEQWPPSETRQRYARHMATYDLPFFKLEARLAEQLSAGHRIHETLGERTVIWALSMEQAPFIASAMTPTYLAAQLTARHKGFDTALSSELRRAQIVTHPEPKRL